MRWGDVRAVAVASAVVLASAVAGCASAPGASEYLPVPTFPAPASQAPAAQEPADPGLPGACERVLPAGDLEALLGLPLGSVAVRTTIGVPEPSVGRTERIACRYTGTPNGPARGETLLELGAARYVDGGAAARQWRTNADVEDGERRDLPIGSAPAVLFERPSETLLTVVDGPATLTVVLPPRTPLPGGRAPADTLVDLALRVLPALGPQDAAPAAGRGDTAAAG